MGNPTRRDLLLTALELMRIRYRFAVIGYVVMPEHVHLLISEPLIGDPSKIIQAYGEAGLVRINDWTWWEEKIQRSAG